MKTKLLYLLFLLLSVPSFAQIEDTDLEEILIDKMSRAQIEQVIIKVRKQTYKNYIDDSKVYTIRHKAILNDSVQLLNTEEDFDISILFEKKKINKTVISANKRKYDINNEFFDRYSFNDSPMYWLTEFVIRKYVNVPDLDFLNNFREYDFQRSVNKGITRIDFYSENSYEGFFTFDTKFNILEVDFELNNPYPIDHSQTKNGKKMFEKNWTYTKEKVNIKFQVNADKSLVIKEMKANEKIEDYNFKRYNSKRELLLEDKKLNFESFLIFSKK